MASPAVAQLPASFPPVPREPLNTENRPATVPTDALPPPALSAPALSVTKTSGSTRELAVPSPAPVPQAQTLIQPKPISIAAEPAKEPVKAPSLFHRRTPSASGSHGSNGSANEANGVAPAAKASKPGLFSRIFHLHDEDSKSPAPGGQQHTEKKKEPGLVDKLFHRERTESAASDRGSASSPALSLNTHGSAKESSNSDRAGTPSTPTEGFGSGLGIFRELWSGSPAPSEGSSHVEQGHGQGKRQASLSRPPSSAALQEKEKASTSLKRTNSEQQLAKYGDMDGKVIGRGATSVVRLAQKKDLPAGSLPTEKSEDNKTYAIKEFRKRRRDETERDYVRKLSTEFCIGHSLHHPNVVSHLELLQTQTGAWCEVLEYCSGGDLCSMIQHGGLTYDEANVFLVQLINGVSYLHGMGVAHKDLKPENLVGGEDMDGPGFRAD